MGTLQGKSRTFGSSVTFVVCFGSFGLRLLDNVVFFADGLKACPAVRHHYKQLLCALALDGPFRHALWLLWPSLLIQMFWCDRDAPNKSCPIQTVTLEWLLLPSFLFEEICYHP